MPGCAEEISARRQAALGKGTLNKVTSALRRSPESASASPGTSRRRNGSEAWRISPAVSAVQHQDGGREQEHAPCGKNAEAGVAGTALMRLVDGDEVADDAASEKVARFVGRGERRWGEERELRE